MDNIEKSSDKAKNYGVDEEDESEDGDYMGESSEESTDSSDSMVSLIDEDDMDLETDVQEPAQKGNFLSILIYLIMDLLILFWNYQGVSSLEFQRAFNSLISSYKADIFLSWNLKSAV